MPYQSESIHSDASQARSNQNHSTQAHSTPAEAGAGTVTVIPAVDLYLGTVTIAARNKTFRLRHPEAQLIARALAQAVRPSTWCEASRTLTVTVAAVGKRHGRPQPFTFGSGTFGSD
ncbi:hypothetical protein [Paenarthrobacter nitroguajacolicus]|uniref:hypothetical protein n=1 Tax=Paenarthrobacter nitroguajacolicus TaxID=211146 RepID=UPI00248D03C8|nr:hypothetical protein [Paenarthrobacter nitroguajacolicus]MDI2036742.1 hypothetical protein [Paenarthrobacter nitroguajacolicus]